VFGTGLAPLALQGLVEQALAAITAHGAELVRVFSFCAHRPVTNGHKSGPDIPSG